MSILNMAATAIKTVATKENAVKVAKVAIPLAAGAIGCKAVDMAKAKAYAKKGITEVKKAKVMKGLDDEGQVQAQLIYGLEAEDKPKGKFLKFKKKPEAKKTETKSVEELEKELAELNAQMAAEEAAKEIPNVTAEAEIVEEGGVVNA